MKRPNRLDVGKALDKLAAATVEVEKALAEATETARRLRGTLALLDAELHALLVNVHPPVCPKCSGAMISRQSRTGGWFWGCKAYPTCKGSLDPYRWREEAEATLRASTESVDEECPRCGYEACLEDGSGPPSDMVHIPREHAPGCKGA